MAKLTLKFKSKVMKEYQFKSDIKIGRIKGNDIVIENPAVSGKHAAIEVIDNHYILKDLESKNGVFVNEKKTNEYELKEGDKILIGKHILEFDFGAGGELIGSEESDDHEMAGMTMMLDTKQFKDLMDKKEQEKKEAAKPAPSEKEKSKSSAVRGKIITKSMSTGRPTEVLLQKSISIIGKKHDSDIVIHGFLCGDVAATIEDRKGKFVIRHRGGFSKTKLNGHIVKDAGVLSDGDEIKIGGNQLIFKEVL